MDTEQLLNRLAHAAANSQELIADDDTGHWTVGLRTDGVLWWSYVCCDEDCGMNEYDEFETLDALAEYMRERTRTWRWRPRPSG